MIVCFSFATACTALIVRDRWPMFPSIYFLGICSYVLLVSVAAFFEASFYANIHPYFESKVGGIDTFARGRGIARQLEKLDAIAIEAEVEPLSNFGFNDDMRGEILVWHDAAIGLTSVEAILKRARSEPGLIRDQARVVVDLERIGEALRKAMDNEIRFCLLFRTSNATNAREWERRRGTAF